MELPGERVIPVIALTAFQGKGAYLSNAWHNLGIDDWLPVIASWKGGGCSVFLSEQSYTSMGISSESVVAQSTRCNRPDGHHVAGRALAFHAHSWNTSRHTFAVRSVDGRIHQTHHSCVIPVCLFVLHDSLDSAKADWSIHDWRKTLVHQP